MHSLKRSENLIELLLGEYHNVVLKFVFVKNLHLKRFVQSNQDMKFTVNLLAEIVEEERRIFSEI